MNDSDHDDMDRMIDTALSGYSEAMPLAGLEKRVLNRIRIAEAERRRPRLLLRLALAVAAGLVVLVIGFRGRHSTVPQPPEVARATRPAASTPRIAPPAPPAKAPMAKVSRGRVGHHPGLAGALPREGQFPTPAPLTSEERAVMAFIAHYPAEAQDAFGGIQKRSNEAINIEAIQVPPLLSDGRE